MACSRTREVGVQVKKLGMGLFIVSIALLSTAAFAQTKTVRLQHRFQAGQIDKYKMSMDMQMNMPGLPQLGGKPFTAKMSMILRQKVLGMLPDGSAKVLVTCSDVKMSSPQMPKMPNQAPPSQSMTLIIDREGRVLAVEGMDAGQMMGSMPGFDPSQLAGQMGFMGIFPEQPIAVGDSWATDIPLPFDSGALNVVSTLLGAAVPVGNSVASKVKQTYQGYMDLGALLNSVAASSQLPFGDMRMNGGMQMTGWTVLYFAPDKGKLLKANGQLNADLSMDMPAQFVSQGAPQSITFNMAMKLSISKI